MTAKLYLALVADNADGHTFVEAIKMVEKLFPDAKRTIGLVVNDADVPVLKAIEGIVEMSEELDAMSMALGRLGGDFEGGGE